MRSALHPWVCKGEPFGVILVRAVMGLVVGRWHWNLPGMGPKEISWQNVSAQRNS